LDAKIAAIEAEIARLSAAGEGSAQQEISCETPLVDMFGISNAMMAARIDPGPTDSGPCVISPDSKYRGLENHLYRVEIHKGGKAGAATFKWSRDNGSVLTALIGISGNDLMVANSRGFTAGCWVELTDEALDLRGERGLLVKVAKVEVGILTVDPSTVTGTLEWSDSFVHPKARRWDQTQVGDIVLDHGAVPIEEASPDDPAWIDLEDGIQIQFSENGEYRSGDYWLIPARVATGDIEWPREVDIDGEVVGTPQLPRGIEHHYAPLCFVQWQDKELQSTNCRCEFGPVNDCFGAANKEAMRSISMRIPQATSRARKKKAARKK
jgi:hypothetical protein